MVKEVNLSEAKRQALTSRSTWVSVIVNIGLTGLQILAGIYTHSQSLVADGLHSLSDLVCDFLVLIAAKHSKTPADDGHPYGHGRIETAASFLLGLILVGTGIAIISAAAIKLETGTNLGMVNPWALGIAFVALIVKESLFRYMLSVGERVRSSLLIANAWHARSDAASSLVVAVGIGGNLMGFTYADAISAIIVGFMIVRMGVMFAWEAFQELIDAGLSVEEVTQLRLTISETEGVLNLHDLKTRKMANRVLLEAHILVDPRLSVSEGHCIAEQARQRVLTHHPDVMEVLVHVDTEEGKEHDHAAYLMPTRRELTLAIEHALDRLPKPKHLVFHFAQQSVDIEVFFGDRTDYSDGDLASIQSNMQAVSQIHPSISSITVYYQGFIAKKLATA